MIDYLASHSRTVRLSCRRFAGDCWLEWSAHVEQWSVAAVHASPRCTCYCYLSTPTQYRRCSHRDWTVQSQSNSPKLHHYIDCWHM